MERTTTLRPPTPCDDGPERDESAGVIPRCKHSTSHTHINGVFTLFIYFFVLFRTRRRRFLSSSSACTPSHQLSLSLSIILSHYNNNNRWTFPGSFYRHGNAPPSYMLCLLSLTVRFSSGGTMVLKRLYGLW